MNYNPRIARLSDWLASERISAALFVDVEGRRDPNIRYLTGQPGDALLFVLSDGKAILIPWDINLARAIAQAGEMIPYSDYGRSLSVAVEAIVQREKLAGSIEVSATTPHLVVEELQKVSGGCEIVCRSKGLDELLTNLRMIKDPQELKLIERAAEITNELLVLLEVFLTQSTDVTEVGVALFLEGEARKRGCEGMSFESLVAGPARSYGIHAFPAYTGAPFAEAGMSILDFGVLVEGYPSDVTVTVLRGPLSPKQQEMVDLVQQAYDLAVGLARPGTEVRTISAAVDELFQRNGYSMPHSLGHGLGLQVHEGPYLRNKPEIVTKLERGMVFTIEPGLYDPGAGGVRLENDLLVSDGGTRILTTSRMLRLR
ncbi:MAG TPA: Xaa-Pro peptidase family protein [Spirochaetia bacterium]|nr:Xaa-Pro peptidase family protein [Spirochaetia bacterium]